MVYKLIFDQMDKVQELLPGIEDFLCQTLAREKLSDEAEEQRLYFVERLDILQLPPTIPPRSSVSRLETTAEIHGSPKRILLSPDRDLKSPTSIEDEDFVAYQRELSRSFLSGSQSQSEEELRARLFNDIEQQQNNSATTELNLYEIPVPKSSEANLPPKENDYEETTSTPLDKEKEDQSSIHVPPPLPPRRDRVASDAQSRSSCGSILEEVKPNLPLRPQLTPKAEIYKGGSMGSFEKLVDGENCDDLDGTSYESYDDEDGSKFHIKLPKQAKKSSKHKKLTKSRSSKEWDLNVPFKCLEEVTLSGELCYKGKLSWTRKMCALSEGRLVCYKPDKCDSKPALVIQLTGYSSSFVEKENRKGYDIKLSHPSLEIHMFSVDFKEWASHWCEYIDAMAEGQPPPGPYQHLARSNVFTGVESSQIYGSRTNLRLSSSQASLLSGDEIAPEFVRSNSFNKPKVSRMGSFAFRASQFFESIGKKTGRKLTSVSSMSNLRDRISSSSLGSPITPATTPETPVFLPEIPATPLRKPATHSGYLCIYSNFNKRKWGRRWCVVRDNTFECFRHESSTVCELDFLLRYCKFRRAVAETKSELGLMLVERVGEKITVEPLSREEMGGWLKVLMNETATDKLPEGLEEFWIEDESPYHDINPSEFSSPTSDAGGYSSIKEHTDFIKHRSSVNHEDSAFDLTANATLISDNQIPCTPEGELTKVQGEITGDLYSQVRKSSTGSVIGESQSCDHDKEADGHCDEESGEKGDSSCDVFMTDEASLFADILNRINDINTQFDNNFTELAQSDTAYNSAVCSENSSLERKPHQDVHSVSENLETLSQGTDIQVSPLEDCCPIIEHIDSVNDQSKKGYENHISAKISSDQSTTMLQNCNQTFVKSNFEFSQTIVNQSNSSIQTFDQSETKVVWTNSSDQTNTHLNVESKSRDQCDSAIFESESILEDLDGSPKALLRKIEQLRTHLVELKKTRISVRNQKEQAIRDSDRNNLDEEYNRLDEECRSITDEISLLEERLSLHTGYSNS